MKPVAAEIWIEALLLSDFPFAVTVNVTVQIPIAFAVNAVEGKLGLAKVPQPLGDAVQEEDIVLPSPSIEVALRFG
jgi:hypothetical protein